MKLTTKLVTAALISYALLSNANDEVVVVGHLKETKEDQYQHRRLQLKVNQRWKDRNGDVVIVPYMYSENTATQRSGRPTDDARRNAAIKKINDQAKVVLIVQRRRSQKAFVEFRSDAKGCYSDVGRIESGTKQILNDSDCISDRSILQELLYALGMFPEHNRKDRDQFVTINLQNVPEKTRHNFNIVDDLESSDLGTPYDYESITHYTDASVITMKNGSSIKERNELSQIDILELRLMYQCISGPRSFSEYNSNPCTSDCKCWEGAVGCNGNNAACSGDLRCANNVCVQGETTGGSGGCTDVPSDWFDSDGDSCQKYATNEDWCTKYGNGFANDGKTANEACCACGGGSNSGTVFVNFKNVESPDLCMDVRGASNIDGAAVIHFQCNGGPNQKWHWDANGYLHSALDFNKCLVGSSGLSDRGTNLIINTCFPDDDRFKWIYYTDSSIRPFNNNKQCIVPSLSEQLDGVFVMQIDDCNGAPLQQWRGWTNSDIVFIYLTNTDSPDLCIDVKGGSTTDGAAVLHYQCNGGSNQKWYWDANNYIRSALDINKCLTGSGGSSDQGTNLIINTCFDNDNRFKWVYYTDFSIRPFNNVNQCVVPSLSEAIDGVLVMQLFDCINAPNQQWKGYRPTRRERFLQTATCTDTPLRWYNSFGDNCEWYAEGTNCEDYGSGLSKFGKTANQACCVCGGGSTANATNVSDYPAVDNMNNCWDTISGWVDSVGDGCIWYSQGDNCQYYGNTFAASTAGRTAKEVCCACGGGMRTPPIDIPSEDTPGCSDSPSRWVDENNDGCDFYAIGDNCEKFGDQFVNYGKTANEACCACKASSSTPTDSPCGLFNLSIFCPFTFCGIFGRLFRICDV